MSKREKWEKVMKSLMGLVLMVFKFYIIFKTVWNKIR